MQLKLVNKGHVTNVVNAETGEKLDNVVDVAFRHEAGGYPILSLTVVAMEAEIAADGKIESVEPDYEHDVADVTSVSSEYKGFYKRATR